MDTDGLYFPIPVAVKALQVVPGVVSKQEILDLCPKANVGATLDDGKDIRWVVIPVDPGSLIDVRARDWIVSHPFGGFSVISDDDFHARYIRYADVPVTNPDVHSDEASGLPAEVAGPDPHRLCRCPKH